MIRVSGSKLVPALLVTVLLVASSIAPAGAAPAARSTDAACPASVQPAEFDDVPADNTHTRSIDCILFWDVTQGAGDNRYLPAATVTRAQMASFIAAVVLETGGTLPDAPPNAFTDDDGNTHEANINKLAAAGIVAGKGGGAFDPGGPVTRGQMATFLVRAYEARTAAELASTADHFPDDNGDTHEATINKAAEQGIASGYANGTYGPLDNVLRDQMASFLARLLDLLVVNGFATLPPAQPVYLGYDITSVDSSCCGWFTDPLNVDGQAYARGVIKGQQDGDIDFIEFDLSRDYARFTAVIGMRDDSVPESTRFKVFGDGSELFTQDVSFGSGVPIDIDTSGILRLRLEVTNLASGSSGTAYPAFADPAVLAY